MKEQLSKRHKIIRYCRKPICALIVSMIVILYSFDSFAAPTNIQSEPLTTYYNISDVNSINPLSIPSFQALYTSLGYNSSNLKLSINQSRSLFYTSNPIDQSLTQFYNIMNNTSVVTSFVNGVTFDFSKAYSILFPYASVQYDHARSCLRCMSPSGSKIYLVCDNDGYWYVVSTAPFICYEQADNNFREVNTLSANGLYCIKPKDINIFNAIGNSGLSGFTDMDILIPSSDGHSGFTSFTTSATDLNIDSPDNVNFNILKTQGVIVGGGDPNDVVEDASQGQFYNYAGVNGSFKGWSQTAVLWDCNFSMNEYMRLHPEEYQVKIQYTANIDKANTNINVPVTYDAIEYIPLSYVTDNGSTYNIKRVVNFNSLTAVSDSSTTLSDGMKNIYTSVTGIDPQYYTDFNFWTFEGTQYSNNPKFALNRSLTTTVRNVYINAGVNIIWDPENDGQDETISGVYRKRIALLDGSEQVMENTISNNYNPPDVSDPQYPAGLNNGGNISGSSYGGGSVSFNPTVTNSFNALVEYMFHIDTDNLLTMQANMSDQYNFVMSKITDNGENGFLTLLSESYDIIPSEIWDWIKAAVGMVLLACTWKIFISNKRLTG